MEVTSVGELADLPGGKRERVLRSPRIVRLPALQREGLRRLADAERSPVLALLQIRLQPQGLREGIAEADIGEPWVIEIHAQGQ